MRVSEKIHMNLDGLIEYGPITIVAFGDSVTFGAVSEGEINVETVYWNRLKKKIQDVRNYIPVNVINAGIGGITAKGSVERMEKQVLCHNPDLIIVCFGLNDVNGTLEDYLDGMQEIFTRCKQSGAETVFMTPNMLNTYVAEDAPTVHLGYAKKMADIQNSGKMDLYMEKAIALANDMGITVCDCYKEWKNLAETKDTTQLLANRINHPTKEMHELFAQMLFDILFPDIQANVNNGFSTMYQA